MTYLGIELKIAIEEKALASIERTEAAQEEMRFREADRSTSAESAGDMFPLPC